MQLRLMILKYLFVCLCLMVACSNKKIAQSGNDPSSPCDCAKTFDELVDKLEKNYVGLALIRGTERFNAYESLKVNFDSKAANQNDSECTKFLGDFLAFFEDGHLFVNEYPRYDSLGLVDNRQYLDQATKIIDEIRELSEDTSDPITGYWTDGESVFSIVKNNDYIDGYLVSSNRPAVTLGSLKLRLSKSPERYEGAYYTYDFNARYVKPSLYKENQVLKMGAVTWYRTTSEEEIIENPKAPRIKKIDEKNTLLTIPSFSFDYKAFQSFLKENKKLLKETSHLIIDIRGNTGGNTIYFPLIGYFATQTLTSRPGYVLTSDDNRVYFKRFIGFGSSKVYSPLLERMTENGKIVDGPQYADRDFGKPKNNIERVSILMDKGCASAAESFILHSKGASDKVVTFGSPSRGMIDFTSVNSLLLKNSGRQNIYFGYPTGTLHQDIMENGYNKTGIMPDVSITEAKDKIQFPLEYFDQEKD